MPGLQELVLVWLQELGASTLGGLREQRPQLGETWAESPGSRDQMGSGGGAGLGV